MKMKRNLSLPRRAGLFFLLAAALILASLAAPFIVPNNPNATNSKAIRMGPCSAYPFGADNLGRCVLSRVLMGARVSVLSALGLVAFSVILGSAVGMVCGYYGGAVSDVVMCLTEILLSFPQMVLAVAVAGILGGGLLNALVSLGITSWTLYARLARSYTLTLKNEPFIAASKLSGCGGPEILFRHVLPNVMGPLLVNATTQIGTTLIGVAGLSFLGLGIVPPNAEWGAMINEGRAYIQLAPWAVLAPAGAMTLTVMVFNYLGDSLRDLADVR